MAPPDVKPFGKENATSEKKKRKKRKERKRRRTSRRAGRGGRESSTLLYRFHFQSQDHLKYKNWLINWNVYTCFPYFNKMNKGGSLCYCFFLILIYVVLTWDATVLPFKATTKSCVQDEKTEIKEL